MRDQQDPVQRYLAAAAGKHLDVLDEIALVKLKSVPIEKLHDSERIMTDKISSLEKELEDSKAKHDRLSRDVVDLKVLLADKELAILRQSTANTNQPKIPNNSMPPPVVNSYAAILH